MKLPTLLTAGTLFLVAAAPAQAAFFPGEAIDGPSADINPDSSGAIEVDIARDGTGAIAYVKNVGGVGSIVVSVLENGVWSAPERVDDGAPAASDYPAVAVASGGRVAVTFENGGEDVYGVYKPGTGQPFGDPQPIQDNPGGSSVDDLQVDMGPTGVAYAVWNLQAVGSDVFVARMENGAWSLQTTPVNTDPDNQASNQGNGPETAIGVDGSGNGVVLWNEVIGTDRKGFVRRLAGTALGAPIEATVDTFEGAPSAGGDVNAIMLDLDVAVDGAAVTVMRQDFDQGGGTRARVLARRLVGDALGAPVSFDNQAFPDFQDNAEMPEIDLAPDGNTGHVASQRNLGNELFAGQITPAGITGLTNLNPLNTDDYTQPAVAASAGGQGLVAMFRANTDVVARYFDGSAFGDEAVLSNSDFGASTWTPGYVDHASADDQGNVAVAFYQGAAATKRVVVASFDAAPGAPTGKGGSRFRKDATPRLSWDPGVDLWGGIQSYQVLVDGNLVGTTAETTFTAPKLSDGRHTWAVAAVDRRGQTTTGPDRQLNIDTKKPKAKLKIRGSRRVGGKVKFVVTARDGRNAAGIARVRIAFGDKKKASKRKLRKGRARFAHRYKKARSFKVKVTVIDKARNRKVVKKRLRIAP